MAIAASSPPVNATWARRAHVEALAKRYADEDQMDIFLDTDLNFPSDDFQALLLLHAAEDVQIIGYGAAAGNTWAEEVAVNLRTALEFVRVESRAPIYSGAPWTDFAERRDRALEAKCCGLRSFIGAYEKSAAPRPWVVTDADTVPVRSTADALVELSLAHPGELTILCIGPLTNLARALEIDSNLMHRLKSVIVMGGHFASDGSSGAKVDFNFWFDPVAADRVMNSGLHVRVVPLDVGRAASATRPLTTALGEAASGQGKVFFDDFHGMQRQHGLEMALCDQTAALLAIDFDLATVCTRGRVQIDTSEGVTRGASSFETTDDGNVDIVRVVDVAAIHRLMQQIVLRMPSRLAVATEAAFEGPGFRYLIAQRLAVEPIEIVPCSFDKTYRVGPTHKIADVTTFIREIRPLAALIFGAKLRGELWPPAPEADAAIARSSDHGQVDLDAFARKELEYLICERFLGVRAIATLTAASGALCGFTCVSSMTDANRQRLKEQFNFRPPGESILAEYSYIERRSGGPWATQFLATQLYCAAANRLPEGDVLRAFAVSLDTQVASIHKLRSFGYEAVAEHIIPSGPERGRRLILYEGAFAHADLARFAKSYGVERNREHGTPAE